MKGHGSTLGRILNHLNPNANLESVREKSKFPGGNMRRKVRRKVELIVEFETYEPDVETLIEGIEDVLADAFNIFIETTNVEEIGNGDNEGDEEVNFD